MAVCVTVGLYAVVAAPFLPNGERPKDRTSRLLDLLLVWTTASAVAQLCWELPFAVLHRWLDGATAADRWAWLWWAYGVADSRYVIADPFVVCMEGFTAAVGGPIELWCIVQMSKGRYREAALATILVGATQWYGTVLYFGIEAFTGFAHVNTASFLDWGLKFFALNALWLVLPIAQVSTAIRQLRAPAAEVVVRTA
jgi:cholestenol delta-isomerase